MGTRTPGKKSIASDMDESSVARQLRPRSSSAVAAVGACSDPCLLCQLPSTSKDTLAQHCVCHPESTPPIGSGESVGAMPDLARKRRITRTRSDNLSSRKQLFRADSSDPEWEPQVSQSQESQPQWLDRTLRPLDDEDDDYDDEYDDEDEDVRRLASPAAEASPVEAEASASTSTDAANTTDTVKSKKRKKKVKLAGRHVCRVCGKVFGSPGKLSQHMYAHTGEKPFECVECPKAFSSKFKLVRHHLIHSEERQYRCSMCERTFHRKDHLKNHLKVHSPVKKTFRCDRPDCVKVYSSYLSYRKHTAFHAAEEGHLDCKMCGKSFSSKDQIEYHLKVHSGSRTVKNPSDKKFSCSHCDRKFFTRKDVRRHLVVHTGKRDFLCQFCPQRFGRKDHLVRHIKKSHNVGMGAALRAAASRGKRTSQALSTEVDPEAATTPLIRPNVGVVAPLGPRPRLPSTNTTTSPDMVQGSDDLLSSVDSVLSTAASSSSSNQLLVDDEGKTYQLVEHIKQERVISPLSLLEPLPAFKLEEIKQEVAVAVPGPVAANQDLIPVYVAPGPPSAFSDQLAFKEEEDTGLDMVMSVGQIDAAVKVVPSSISPLLPTLEENHFIPSLSTEATSSADADTVLQGSDFLHQLSAEEVIRLLNTDLSANNTPLPRFNQAFQQQPPP